jgi:hypothetical protein
MTSLTRNLGKLSPLMRKFESKERNILMFPEVA